LLSPGYQGYKTNASNKFPLLSTEGVLLLVLLIIYVVMGLIGHDPWKADEGYVFGVIHSLLRTGDWIVPTLAGHPFMEKPPLYYLVAAGCVKLFQPWLDPVNSARLASGFFTAITLYCIGWSTRRLWGSKYGIIGALLLVSSIGLLQKIHYMVSDVALLSGFGLATCAFIILDSRPYLSGFLLGLGIGVGFLAKGLLAPGVLGITALVLPIFAPEIRNRQYLKTLLLAAVVSAPWLLVWPIALYLRSPNLFFEWFLDNNFGRFLGTSDLGPGNSPMFFLYTLIWFALPSWPLALFSIYRRRTSLLNSPATKAHIVLFILFLSVLLLSATARATYALPLLLPLVVLGCPEVDKLPNRLSTGINWGCSIFFGGLALVAWAIWVYMQLTGHPPNIDLFTMPLSGSFKPSFDIFPFVVAVVITFFWILLLFKFRSHPYRALIGWVGGMTLCWSLANTLLLPWINDALSYRAVMISIREALPADHGCIESRNLYENEQGMADYYADIITVPESQNAETNCSFLLIETRMGKPDLPKSGWMLLWHGQRPADRLESFWLFRRDDM
jgi:4-amino-4-deoxy-L-arabinose transferase-like glycosyltransferase